jgi:hypothetical protein
MSVVADAIVRAEPPPGYELVWSDEFNGARAGLDKNWDFQNGPSGHMFACDEDSKRGHSFDVRIPLEPAR